MKATKVPENIYIGIVPSDHGNYKYTTVDKDFPDAIEYTRADTFIEKACEWIKESITNNPDCNRIISKKGIITMGLLIDDFKTYMKGD